MKYDNILNELKLKKEEILKQIEEIEKEKVKSNKKYYEIKEEIKEIKEEIELINNKIQTNLVNHINISNLIEIKEKKINKLENLIVNPENNILEIYKNYDLLINKNKREIEIIEQNKIELDKLILFHKNNITSIYKNTSKEYKNIKLIEYKNEILRLKQFIREKEIIIKGLNNELEETEVYFNKLFEKELFYKNNCIKRKEISSKRIEDKFNIIEKQLEKKYNEDETKNNDLLQKITNIKKNIIQKTEKNNLDKKNNSNKIELLKKENILKKKEIINIKIDIQNIV